jgi:hypothetical protein
MAVQYSASGLFGYGMAPIVAGAAGSEPIKGRPEHLRSGDSKLKPVAELSRPLSMSVIRSKPNAKTPYGHYTILYRTTLLYNS